MEKVKPSDLKNWADIDQRKAVITSAKKPYLYGWYLLNGLWHPHRLPTVKEIETDIFA